MERQIEEWIFMVDYQILRIWIQRFYTRVYLVTLSFLYVILIPLGLLLLLPLYIIRFFILIYWKLFKSPEQGSIVSTRNCVFAVDNPYKNPKANLVVCFTFEGIVDLSKWRQHLMTRIVEKKSCQGKIAYPQLKQFLTKKFGYFFWIKDPLFDISNHVKLHDNDKFKKVETFSQTEIISLQLKLITSPFENGKSPWEFILLHCHSQQMSANGQMDPSKTIVFFKLHHSLSDGFSILKILMSDIADQPMSDPIMFKLKKSTTEQERTFCTKFIDFFKIPYEQVKQRFYSMDLNPWHNSKLILRNKYHIVISRPIQVALIKSIKNLHQNSTFTSIVLSAISAGICQHFRTHVSDMDHQKLKYFHTICPIPIPGRREDKLGNYWSFCFVKLPICGPISPRERLCHINKNLKKLSKSQVSTVNFALIPIVGALPSGLIRLLGTNIFSTGITSIFAGPSNPCYWNDHLVVDANFAGGLLGGNQGICFTLLSYNGKFRIVLMVDEALVRSKGIVDNLLDNIVQEINVLSSDNLA